MKRHLLLCLCLFVAAIAMGKRVRIPKYHSFVYWVQGVDTAYSENHTLLHESISPDSGIVIRVRHEDWQNTITPKSEARLFPWHATMSQKRGLRAIISQKESNVDAMRPMRKDFVTTPAAISVENLSSMTDQLEMNLACEYMIENSGTQEVVINDLNRGLVWYLPPQSYLLLNMGTLPQACMLRIANNDAPQSSVKYVTIGSASFEMKLSVAHENDDYWILILDEERFNTEGNLDFSRMLDDKNSDWTVSYIKRDKDTFCETRMTADEVYAIINEAKREEKAARRKK